MGCVVCLDCFSGISGDMFAAAFIHAGVVSAEELSESLSRLGVGLVTVKAEKVSRASIGSIHIEFESPEAPSHLHADETQKLVETSTLTDRAKAWILEAWQAILEAEASVHGTEPDHVHLHEMGHIDTLFDLTCAAAIAEKLENATFYMPRLVVGMGQVKMQHGVYPVPAPATVALLKGIPWTAGDVEAELATPTGAAIVRALQPRFTWPEARWSNVGYGAGGRDLPRPNVLRVLVGEAAGDAAMDEVVLLLADMDDMSPELSPYAQERLLEAGALDVSAESILMKKGRPGLRIQVMSPPHLADALTEVMFRETTTLGVRCLPVKRRVLDREVHKVETAYGVVRVKVGSLRGQVVNVSPEYEDCQQLARSSGVPLKVIYQAAVAAAPGSMRS